MLFNSYQFILGFVPITVIVYFLLNRADARWRLSWLLLASLVFYGWWNPVYVPLLVASILINYVIGSYLAQAKSYRRQVLIAGIGFNLTLIGFFKYAGFAVANLNLLPGVEIADPHLVLPLAISFFTFQQIAFLVDSYRGMVPKVSLLNYSVFVTFFPQLIAGPIVHHAEMMPQFATRKKAFDATRLATALSIFTIGLFKKTIIADNLAPTANVVFAKADAGAALSTPEAIFGPLSYTFQLYFDFSGYSDMAIGLGLLIGISLPINFMSPYQAESITDFWRCWHMTLSRFLKDYLYIPLGGNRKGKARRYINLMITMLLGGLWHGAGWTYVIWGGLHGALLLGHHLWQSINARFAWFKIPRVAAVAITFISVMICWIFFRAETVDGAMNIISSLVNPGDLYMTKNEVKNLFAAGSIKLGYTIGILIAAFLIAFFAPNAANYHLGTGSKTKFQPDLVHLGFILVLWGAIFMSVGGSSEFLYFQF